MASHFDIHFACTATHSVYSVNLIPAGIKTDSIALNNPSFDTYIVELNPAMVIFDRFLTEEQFGWRVAENCPDAIRILNTEDLHGLRSGRMLAVKEGRDFTENDLMNEVMKHELASI